MKKLIPLLLVVLTFAACEKDPDTDKLDNKYLVYTNYDSKADFKAFQTYYMPDSILVIGDKKEAEYWKDESAQEILQAYATNMNNRGFVRVDDREEANLGLQVATSRALTILMTTDVPNGGGTIQVTGMHLTGVTGADGTIRML